MRDLIARIEAATGPDRELDMAILTEVGHAYIMAPPHYTASLDAAVSLVPAGHGWTVDGNGVVIVSKPGKLMPPRIAAATPALAMCAAALRARLAEQEASDA